MTTNPTPIQEPTFLTDVVVGTRNGKAAVAVRMDEDERFPWILCADDGYWSWHSWTELRRELTDIRVVDVWDSWPNLCDELTDIRVVDLAEVARPTKAANCARCDRIEAHALGIEGLLGRRREQLAKARGEIDQLKARIADLEGAPALSGEQVEALRCAEKWLSKEGLAALILRDAFPGAFERAPERAPEPEPGADIPDEVVDEALDSFMNALEGHERPKGLKVRNFMRDALAAADAKRAELEGQA